MTAGNKRKENTFRTKGLPEAEPLEEQLIDTEENIKEEKPKKESPKKSEKSTKSKAPKPQKTKEKQESDGRVRKIIGILFICLAVFLGLALISYLVNFFSGHHQECGYQIFSKKIEIESRTGSLGVFLAQTLLKESFGIGSFFFVHTFPPACVLIAFVSDRNFRSWLRWCKTPQNTRLMAAFCS